MTEEKSSSFSHGLIWFGASISIAEILTGTLFAPLGFWKGFITIVLGHLIGAVIFYLAGVIGANEEKSSMETVKISFGEKGSVFFSLINVIQLIGWTAVMIISGSLAANYIYAIEFEFIWSLLIGGLILVWILLGIKNLNRLNIFIVSGLFILTIILGVNIFNGRTEVLVSGELTFGQAIELAVAMPLSWLPLISDYTRNAENKKTSPMLSSLTYFIGSVWMYAVGLGAVVFMGETNIAAVMVATGIGLVGLLIIILSTVTTTFLDAYSAGVSARTITDKLSEKSLALICALIGIILAITVPIMEYENFLYFISSVFAPMIAVLLTDYFILKKRHSDQNVNVMNLVLWLIGFIIYRMLMGVDLIIGYTVPVMLIVSVLTIIANRFKGERR